MKDCMAYQLMLQYTKEIQWNTNLTKKISYNKYKDMLMVHTKDAMRCGKKEGGDPELDLLKIIHYAIIAIALEDTEYHLGDTDD